VDVKLVQVEVEKWNQHLAGQSWRAAISDVQSVMPRLRVYVPVQVEMSQVHCRKEGEVAKRSHLAMGEALKSWRGATC